LTSYYDVVIGYRITDEQIKSFGKTDNPDAETNRHRNAQAGRKTN